jgi:hypothetical protein
MLILETHNDVVTKADSKEGSMSIASSLLESIKLIGYRDFPLPPFYPKLSASVCKVRLLNEKRNCAESSIDTFPVLYCLVRSIKVRFIAFICSRKGRLSFFLGRSGHGRVRESILFQSLSGFFCGKLL